METAIDIYSARKTPKIFPCHGSFGGASRHLTPPRTSQLDPCLTKTYQEHVALKKYALEHTKPLFNKHSLLTLHNLYASRSLVELIKILKLHSPYPVYENL